MLPVTKSAIPGANGSLWVTEHYAHNHSDSTMWVTNNFSCQWSAVHASDVEVPSRSTVRIARAYASGVPYEFWGVTEGSDEAFSVTSFVRNINGDTDPWGTALPVAGGDDFRTQPVHIAPVPADPAYRVSLRAWAWSGRADSLVAEIVDVDEWGRPGDVLGTVILPRVPESRSPSVSSYFEIHDLLSAIADRDSESRVGIRISAPSAPDAFLWSFASITHNDSQHVTVFAP